MSIYHIHHIVPKHAGGTDDPKNLIKLSIEEHAEAHKKLYEQFGRQEDYLAWKGLAGLIGKDELLKEVGNIRNLKNKNPEKRLKNSLATKKQWEEGRGVLDQTRIRIATKQKYGVENVRNLKVTCPHCHKVGQVVAFKRWHFDKCKMRCI